ncbi:mannose-1-phosphate guanylyltransferase [Flavobacterium sp. DSR3-2]|uniref:mannose-1-phosphate guanylyltransferase n=1 Tax=Flavobacterium sp. DSR3-2 TaxID=2804634 RepID=UPI003CEFF357
MEIENNIINVVLSGGIGSRLWPLSRKFQPKQYLELFKKKSLFEMTIERNANIADKIVVVGNIENYNLSCEVMKKFSIPHSFITEATPRNTAAAIAFAAFDANPEDILIITPSDHIIDLEDLYVGALTQAVAFAKNNYIVTFGIKPSKPESGYGYIEFKGENVLAFHEKPNLEKASEFLEKGNYYWNSGLFCFKSGLYLAELEKHEPEVYRTAKLAWDSNIVGVLNYELSLQIPSISVDYAVMEQSKKIKVVPSYFNWSDLGSYESVYDYLVQEGHPIDANGNITIGSDISTFFVGIKNCLLVHTPDALLVLQKEKSQDIKQLYKHLKSINSPLL